jgi:hypothetical protein
MHKQGSRGGMPTTGMVCLDLGNFQDHAICMLLLQLLVLIAWMGAIISSAPSAAKE